VLDPKPASNHDDTKIAFPLKKAGRLFVRLP